MGTERSRQRLNVAWPCCCFQGEMLASPPWAGADQWCWWLSPRAGGGVIQTATPPASSDSRARFIVHRVESIDRLESRALFDCGAHFLAERQRREGRRIHKVRSVQRQNLTRSNSMKKCIGFISQLSASSCKAKTQAKVSQPVSTHHHKAEPTS